MTVKEEATAFGRPVLGEINRYTEGLKEQHDPQLFVDALDILLKYVEAIQWRQYTPYFNDGEPCTFSIYGFAVAFGLAEEEGETDEGIYFEAGDYEWKDEYSLYEYSDTEKVTEINKYSGKPYTTSKKVWKYGDDPEAFGEAVKAFETVLESGHHDAVLCEKFGDPSIVTATKDGFKCEFYEHD